MNTKSRILGFFGGASMVLAGMGATSCGNRNPDINSVQPGYVKKALFTTGDEWYMRRTIIKSETTNRYAVEGQGDIILDRVKFRIEEDVLIAYRAYEAIPGSQSQERKGKTNFEGSVLAMWPITSHFDILRRYDVATGNELNEIIEQSSDRHWYDRDYMRVDFATNLSNGTIATGRSAYDFPVEFLSTGSYWKHCDSNPTDPFCSRFTEDTIDIVDKSFLGMDLINCAAFVGYSYSGYGNCGFGEAMVRTNFTRVKNPSDFIPRDYPESYVRTGPDGQPIYDEETGEVVREPIYERFGFFRLEVPTYDRGYGTTESGRLFRALIFNLWERHTDEAGNEIPYAQRTPKPIIYHLNAEYPPRWRQAAKEVGDDYNRVFTEMVADLQGKSVSEIPAMFEIRDNDCNEGNIRNYVTSKNKDVMYAVQRAVCAAGESCNNPLDKIGIGNLKNVCTSLENATRDQVTGIPDFDWQREGDSRHKMVIWLSNPQQSGWGGYGPMYADARTGETVSAGAHLRGFSYERASATIVDYIEFMNDEKTVEEVIYGQDIRKHVSRTLAKASAMSSQRVSPEAIARIDDRMARLGSTAAELLPKIDPNFQTSRMKRIEGTSLEADMVDPLIAQLVSGGKWKPGDDMNDELRHRASHQGWSEIENPLSEMNERNRQAMTNAGFCFLDHDFDQHWAGLALQLKDMTREDRYQFVGNMMIKHVMAHELGHNVGLAHNFEGSYDALNYDDAFWANHWSTPEERTRNRYDEKRNTTVMEYMSAKGAFTPSLGKYDVAALRFAYGNQVQVFNKPTVDGGLNMRRWRYRSDYNKVPEYLCAGNEEQLSASLNAGQSPCSSVEEQQALIKDRSWVTFDPQMPPTNEVPYLFCDNYYNRRTPFCATFDFGSSQREIFANYYSMWRDYFFFNNFVRDRLSPLAWSPSRAIYPVYYAMGHWATVGQYYYFFQAFDPSFKGTDLETDMLTTVFHGLNFASEVISTPEPDRFCPWPGVSDPQVFIPWYYISDSCDPYAEVNSTYAIENEAIHLPLGPARPASLGFTDDYVDYSWAFVGSYFDKYNVMWLLGAVRRNLFMRFDFEGGQLGYHDRYNYSVYRILEPEIRDFYEKILVLDSYLISSNTARDLGSYWCRDQDQPESAYMGYYEPRQMVDPVSGQEATAPASCQDAALIYPRLLGNAPFSAMFFAHAYFSSPFDTALDMGKSLKVYVVGSDDEFPDWKDLPADEICSCVDSLTGLDYRAIRQPEDLGVASLGCRLVERTCEAQDAYEQDESSDYYRDRWRSWFERLENARDLARIFDGHRRGRR
jgi:hypothetical protein